ncbi:MAG: DUF3817 domain-containing protein [Kordiimonadaceae bacterium]|jgi:integral membrane protein|nr:DUF3817 domain-containing protein [Kordiimonadaceae bacterium]MBT6033788.1 DUF3817 domain-containing protein [Kordiimonadaceae bacterium]
MFGKLKDPIQRLRTIAFIEGLSFLTLLFISMPLKYYMGMAEFSYYVGLTHGYLFITYLVIALDTLVRRKITVGQFFWVFIVSIIPFGTFLYDPRLKLQQEKIAAEEHLKLTF